MATTDASLAAARSVDALAESMRRAAAAATAPASATTIGRQLADAARRGQLQEFFNAMKEKGLVR